MTRMEDYNCTHDPRNMNAEEYEEIAEGFNERTMKITLVLIEEDEDGETVESKVRVPAEFAVCPSCDGKGTHVNPSIDASGLTAEDFAEDPDFRDEYFSGAYDVQCYTCHGKRVVPEPRLDNLPKDVRERVERHLREQQEWRAEARMERALGA